MALNASVYKKEEGEEKNYNLQFYKNFARNLRATLSLERRDSFDSKRDDRIYLNLYYTFDHAYSASYSGDLTEKSHALSLAYNTAGSYGLNSHLDLRHTEQSNQYRMGMNYNDEKFRLNTSYGYTDQSSRDSSSASYDMQLATGIAFAGRTATITAPINSSFVIVDNDDRLKKPLGIAGRQESDAFIYDTYALNLSDYTVRDITVDESNLDFGMDLKYANNKFSTFYHSGSVMDIEVQNFYALKGVFHDKKTRQIIASKAFKVFNTTTGVRTMGFTDETGAFTINHLDKGAYNLTFVKEAGYQDVARYKFEIKEMKQSLVDMGDLYVKLPKKVE